MEADFKKILIVGAGTMGHGLAQVFAQAGYRVALFSRTQQTLDRAFILMKSSLDTMVEADLVEKTQIDEILSRISPTRSLEEGAAGADLAIETVVEDKDAKMNELAEIYSDARNISWLDGVTIEYNDFWFNVRPSNTEPLLRLNLEARTRAIMEEKRDEVLKVIRQ